MANTVAAQLQNMLQTKLQLSQIPTLKYIN